MTCQPVPSSDFRKYLERAGDSHELLAYLTMVYSIIDEGWTRTGQAKLKNGKSCSPHNPKAKRFTLGGATEKVCKPHYAENRKGYNLSASMHYCYYCYLKFHLKHDTFSYSKFNLSLKSKNPVLEMLDVTIRMMMEIVKDDTRDR